MNGVKSVCASCYALLVYCRVCKSRHCACSFRSREQCDRARKQKANERNLKYRERHLERVRARAAELGRLKRAALKAAGRPRERKCLGCSKTFLIALGIHLRDWCTPACYRESKATKRETLRKCLGCEVEFFVSPTSQQKWCSSRCSNRRYIGKEVERFWAKVDWSSGPAFCWPWMGGRHLGDGRGRVSIEGGSKTEYASRMTWKLAYGPIPDGMWVLHKCDNPPCCNPIHLFLGTAKNNSVDCQEKGRGRFGTKVKE